MPQDQVRTAVLLGILALLSLIPTAVAWRRARAFGDWNATSTLVFLVGILANAPTVAYVLHSGRPQLLDPLGEVVIGFPQWVNRIGTVANAVLFAACAVFAFLRVVSGRVRPNGTPLIACGLVILLAFSDGLHGQQVFTPRQLVLLVVLLAVVVARPGRGALLGGAAVVLLFSLLSGIAALIQPTTVLRPCRTDNPCGVLGVLYAGVFTNENIFSLILVLGLPFIWLALRGPVRAVLACYVAFTAVATGSTLASVSAVVVLAFLFVMAPRLPDERASGPVHSLRPLLALLTLGAAAAVGLAAPFHHPGVETLGDRATIWDMARGELRQSVLIGFGGKTWSAKYRISEIPAAVSPSLHNEWIDLLYAGGLVGLGLFLLLLARLLLGDGAAGIPVAASVLLPVLLTSILERPWAFAFSNSLSFCLIVALLTPVGRASARGSRAADRGRRDSLPDPRTRV
ncbi:hypothetical protein [Streptomyces sp. NPDC057403]|uniref:hypothetical protein n=1 Tax=Streptomyces sp. NPDC057403 TaxID=3346119 RepID=UPI0036A4A1AD